MYCVFILSQLVKLVILKNGLEDLNKSLFVIFTTSFVGYRYVVCTHLTLIVY